MRDIVPIHPVTVDQSGPVLAKENNVVATPDTFGFSAAFQAVRATVHGGNYFPKLLALTEVLCDVEGECGQYNPGGSFPVRTQCNRAPPQLAQVQMVCRDVACHAVNDVPPTKRTRACLQATKPALTLPALQLQVSLALRHFRQQGWRPMSPKLTQVRCRNSWGNLGGHILKQNVVETPGLPEDSNNVLGLAGQHPDRFSVIIKCLQTQEIWNHRGVKFQHARSIRFVVRHEN